MVAVGNEGSEVNVDGAAKMPGTVTVRVTRSVDVEVRSEAVDKPVDMDMFEIVKVWSVVGKDAKDVVVTESDDVNELEDMIVLVVVVEVVVKGTVTKTPGTEEVVVIVLVELIVVLEAEPVAAADSVTVMVTTETPDVVDIDKPELDIVVVVVVVVFVAVVADDVLATTEDETVVVVVLEYDTVADALP